MVLLGFRKETIRLGKWQWYGPCTPWLGQMSKSISLWFWKQRELGWIFHCVFFYCKWRFIFDPRLPDFNPKYHLKGTAFLHITKSHDKNNSGKPPKKVKAPWPSLLNSEGKPCTSPGKCFCVPFCPSRCHSLA